MHKTTIKKNPRTTTLFPFADLRDKFPFPGDCQLVSILGGLGWSKNEMRPWAPWATLSPQEGYQAQMQQRKGAENQPSQE